MMSPVIRQCGSPSRSIPKLIIGKGGFTAWSTYNSGPIDGFYDWKDLDGNCRCENSPRTLRIENVSRLCYTGPMAQKAMTQSQIVKALARNVKFPTLRLAKYLPFYLTPRSGKSRRTASSWCLAWVAWSESSERPEWGEIRRPARPSRSRQRRWLSSGSQRAPKTRLCRQK